MGSVMATASLVDTHSGLTAPSRLGGCVPPVVRPLRVCSRWLTSAVRHVAAGSEFMTCTRVGERCTPAQAACRDEWHTVKDLFTYTDASGLDSQA